MPESDVSGEIVLHVSGAIKVKVIDCRNTANCVSVRFCSLDVAVAAYLSPDQARDLHSKLHAILFPGPG